MSEVEVKMQNNKFFGVIDFAPDRKWFVPKFQKSMIAKNVTVHFEEHGLKFRSVDMPVIWTVSICSV